LFPHFSHIFPLFPPVFALGCSALEAAGHAKELQSLFEIFASASDMRMLEQVQELSDVILRGLDRVVETGTRKRQGLSCNFGMGGWLNIIIIIIIIIIIFKLMFLNYYNMIIHRYRMIEGSLEVKLPTIWTDEKQSREEAERRERLEERRVEEKQ
jgi:hypothetical protein